MVFVILVTFLALGVASPYIIVVRKRQRMLKRLTLVARRSGFRVRRLHRFVCFSFNRAPKYDLLFESRTHAYAVKLWSAVRKNATLYIKANGAVMEKMDIPAVMDTEVSSERAVSGREKRVPITANNFKVKKDKTVVRVMLYYPPNKKMILISGESQKSIGSGDRLFDKTVFSPGKFEQMLIDDGELMRRDMVALKQRAIDDIQHKIR